MKDLAAPHSTLMLARSAAPMLASHRAAQAALEKRANAGKTVGKLIDKAKGAGRTAKRKGQQLLEDPVGTYKRDVENAGRQAAMDYRPQVPDSGNISDMPAAEMFDAPAEAARRAQRGMQARYAGGAALGAAGLYGLGRLGLAAGRKLMGRGAGAAATGQGAGMLDKAKGFYDNLTPGQRVGVGVGGGALAGMGLYGAMKEGSFNSGKTLRAYGSLLSGLSVHEKQAAHLSPAAQRVATSRTANIRYALREHAQKIARYEEYKHLERTGRI